MCQVGCVQHHMQALALLSILHQLMPYKQLLITVHQILCCTKINYE